MGPGKKTYMHMDTHTHTHTGGPQLNSSGPLVSLAILLHFPSPVTPSLSWMTVISCLLCPPVLYFSPLFQLQTSFPILLRKQKQLEPLQVQPPGSVPIYSTFPPVTVDELPGPFSRPHPLVTWTRLSSHLARSSCLLHQHFPL